MFNINIVIIIMMFIIIQQSTSILQKNNVQKRQVQSIQCGSKYLKETIGISLTNNHLYQFLFIDNMIQIIRYDYQRLSENIDKNDYKLNLIDGQMLANGLEDLIPSDIVEQLMTVIHRTDNDDIKSKNNSNESTILSISMSINTNGKIRIYCIKSLNRMKYYIGDYNQEINSGIMETFISKNDQQQIRGIISNQNEGILSLYYSKTSFCLNMVKLKENYPEWSKILVIVNSSLNFIYEINEYLNEQQLQTLTKSFDEIFGQHTFTYGFVSDNDQMFLFANPSEKLISFSMNIFKNNSQKYPFNIQSYHDFFYCNKSLDFIDNEFNVSATIMGMIAASIIVFILLIGLFVYCLRKISAEKIQKKLPLTSPKQQINLDGKFSSESLMSPATTITSTTMTEKLVSASSMISKTPANKVIETSLPVSSISKTPRTIKGIGKPTIRSSISKISITSKVSGKSLPVSSSISKTPKTTKMSKVRN
ncbi:uncharacterized protein LOC142646028 [Dermatophagoides pteronyssinus]|uniref:uncharacterized protein LOC142646028 n=1 Tax=Dermatophagoides pteronyssinus TaxID=6956 RepID=UPI003F66DDAE